MALTDIARATAPERLAHARAIRHRLRELVTRLGVRIPVYALFTKADLIAGFSEFFDDLDSERRGQVWGTTFAETRDDAGAVAGFTSAFGELVARLNGRLYDRLQAERSPDRRALITGFPSQVASLEAPLAAFLQEAFGGSKLDPAPFLRGVYMTSGTQEGTPIDRLTGVLTRAFGLQQKPAPSLRAVRGRSYFLTRLLRDVVFQEAMLVADRPRARRRRFVLRAAGYTGLALITVLAGAFIWQTGEAEQHEVARVADALLTYDKTAKVGPLDPVQDGDLPGVLPLLDQARALPEGYDVPRSLAPAWSVLGLSQSAKLSATSRALYRNALERVLLPRLIWRLEAQMRARLNQPDFLYEATRVYLMLGGGGPLDPALVQVWMNLDWQAAYPGPIQAPVRAGLLRHLDALLADPLPPVSLDGGLVGVARATFNQVSFAQRVYSRIRPSAAAQRIPAWIPLEALGAAGATLFTRASGRPLEDGVPGFYTLAGFHEVLLPALAGAARSVAAESWVLGRTISLDQGQIEALESGVIRLYEADYAGEWDALMADLQLIPVRSLTQAAQAFYILGAPESPMRALLASIARQLTLSVPPGGNVSVLPNGAPGSEIDARYQALRTVMGTGAGAPIDQVLRTLNDLQQQLAKLAAAPVGTVPPPPGSNDPAAALKAIADKQPKPLAAWLASMAAAGISLRASGR
jgi:type VI secretion system protein ImpL